MVETKLNFTIPNTIDPGTQVGQWGVLAQLAEHVGKEMNVSMQTYDLIKAEDPDTKPTFMYLLGPVEYAICLTAHGLNFRRDFDPGPWDINPIEIGNRMREAIEVLQREYDGLKTPKNV